MGRILRRVAVLGVAGLVAASAWLVLRPPGPIRAAAGYAAKIVCSNTFIAGRDPDQVLTLDGQAPGHPLLRLMRVAVDLDARTVRAGLFGVAGDGRREIALADLLAMASGPAFDEDCGSVSDVTRMLYLEPDMAAFAAAKPLAHPVGSVFNYANGSSGLLARLWQDAVGTDALAWPRRALFEPLGMRSAVLEADARGSFVGSSYPYATAGDWARFGQLLLQDGLWEGRAVLPPGRVARMFAPSASGPTQYSQGQMWLHGPAGTHRPGRIPMRPSACRPMRGGCSATSARRSRSCRRGSRCWCGWGCRRRGSATGRSGCCASCCVRCRRPERRGTDR